MTTTPALTLHSLPPPLELRAADLVVGGIDGDIVRFHGFDSEDAAALAAAVAHEAMLRRLARGTPGTGSTNESDLASARRKGDHTNAPGNGRPVASVLRSVVDGIRGADAGDFAFEIRVPPPIDELGMRSMAHVMYRALRSAGVAWPLFRTGTAPEALPAVSTRAVTDTKESKRDSAPAGLHDIKRFLDRASRDWAFPWTRPQRAG